ncbi:MAG: hypothetical protein J6X52_00030, partial [Clostridia bacterium]|nr:hypothetical protein [Clostridia bacterium]
LLRLPVRHRLFGGDGAFGEGAQGGEPAVKKYLEFLSSGCRKDPISLLRGAGVDMDSPEPIAEALKLFDSLIDELESLVG